MATEMENVLLTVGGMSCQHCAKTVQSTAERVPGVSAAKVDLDRETLAVSVDAARRDEIVKRVLEAVEEAGYEPRA